MNLLKTLAKISGMTTISRILGFVRDTVTAQMFGSNAATDAFFVAFKLPNLLRRIFAEGAFSQAFVPILHFFARIAKPINVSHLLFSKISFLDTGINFVGNVRRKYPVKHFLFAEFFYAFRTVAYICAPAVFFARQVEKNAFLGFYDAKH